MLALVAGPSVSPHCFVSYARDDAEDLDEFLRHLAPVQRKHRLDVWVDRNIAAGQAWRGEIAEAIARAEIFMLLLTPAFLASNYVCLTELPAIQKAREERGALIVSIVVRNCLWQYEHGDLHVVPTDASGRVRPVRSWPTHADGFVRAADLTSVAIERYRGATARRTDDRPAPGAAP